MISLLISRSLHEVKLRYKKDNKHCKCTEGGSRVVRFASIEGLKLDPNTAYLLPSLYFNFKKCKCIENLPRQDNLIEDAEIHVSVFNLLPVYHNIYIIVYYLH